MVVEGGSVVDVVGGSVVVVVVTGAVVVGAGARVVVVVVESTVVVVARIVGLVEVVGGSVTELDDAVAASAAITSPTETSEVLDVKGTDSIRLDPEGWSGPGIRADSEPMVTVVEVGAGSPAKMSALAPPVSQINPKISPVSRSARTARTDALSATDTFERVTGSGY